MFTGLRDAIVQAQSRMGPYREALKRAEAALRAGDLEAAKQAVEDAQAILPDDPGARTLAGQIITRLEAKLREQRTVAKHTEFARTLNAAEKGMADARMLLSLGQAQQALQMLENMESEVTELPPQWMEQFRALKREVREKRDELARPVPATWSENFDGQTVEIPAQFNEASVLRPDTVEAGSISGADRVPEVGRFSDSKPDHDVLYPNPRVQQTRRPERRGVAPEMREFLEEERSGRSRPTVWLGIAVVVLVGVVAWLLLRPTSQSAGTAKPAGVSDTYAEINAEPWATQ